MGRKVSIEVPSQGPNHTYKFIIDVQDYDGPVCFGIYEGGWVTVMLKGDQRNLSPLPYTAKRESGDWSGTITVQYSQYTLFISSAENLTYFNTISSLSEVTVVGGHLIDGPISQTRAEMYPNVAEYFDNYVPGQGVGEVTIQTEAPSQLLTFTSRELGQSFKYWIRGNQTIKLYTPGEEPSSEFVRVTELPQQTYTDTYLDGWSGEYISEAAIDTTNLLLLLIRIDADPYIVSRFYMNGVRSKRYSSTYGLHDTGISITQYQQSQLPGHWTGVVYEQRNSHAAVEYKTNITILEFNNTASKILGCSIDSVWLAAGLIEDSSYKIDLPGAGVYLVYASMGLQGAYDEEYVAIKDGNSILCEVTAVDNYGWTSTPVYGLVEASSAKSLYFHGYHRSSGTCSVYMMALRLPSSCVIRTITYSNQTCTSTLTSVANISLQPGKYIIIAETNFPSVGGENVYHEAVIGQKTIFAGANVYLTEYSPILNSIGYIHVLTTTTLYLNAKSTTNASVSGYIKALQLVDPR